MSYAINVSHAYNGENAKRLEKFRQICRAMLDKDAAAQARSDHERPSALARRRKLNRYWNRATRWQC